MRNISSFRAAVDNILQCYQAEYPGSYIKLASENIPVFWGHFSIVQAELNCLQDLMNNGHNWSYALDLAGSESVLYTNKEIGEPFFEPLWLISSHYIFYSPNFKGKQQEGSCPCTAFS